MASVRGFNKVTVKAFIFSISLFFIFIGQLSAKALVSEQIKGLYLYNFIKHISWPETQQNTDFVIAVYQDKKFFNILQKSLSNKVVKGRVIRVLLVSTASQAKTAQIFYIPKAFNTEVEQLAREARSSQTLLITNNIDNKNDVMINLSFNEDASVITFEINKSNIIYEQLKISPELLLLGGTELDIAMLYRATEKKMQEVKTKEIELNKQLVAQQQEIENSSNKLINLNAKLKQSAQEFDDLKGTFKQIKADVLLQKKELLQKELDLSLVSEQLSSTNSLLSEQSNKAQEAKDQITQNNKILAQQKQEITKTKQQIDLQSVKLVGSQLTIDNQKTTIVITSIVVAVALFIIFIVFYLWMKNRRTTLKLSKTISTLEQTQDQLVESKKMASLGSLVAGVAHEINTPLGIAITSTTLINDKTFEIEKMLIDKTLSQKDLAHYIDVVKRSAKISNTGLDRVIILLNNFKQVAADQIVEEAREINFAEYVDEVFTTLIGELKTKKVQYHFIGDRDIRITTIPGALAQVVTNLVTNAIRHAFENRTTGNLYVELTQQDNDNINFVFRDDGAGIEASNLDKVFAPFFTTKRNKGGTGLGLNIVYNIIHQKLAGKIKLESVYGEGTVFTITLPKILPNLE